MKPKRVWFWSLTLLGVSLLVPHQAIVAETDLTPLATLTSLEILDLHDTQVSDEEVQKLQRSLPKCGITDR